jgi:hypothetical protein
MVIQQEQQSQLFQPKWIAQEQKLKQISLSGQFVYGVTEFDQIVQYKQHQGWTYDPSLQNGRMKQVACSHDGTLVGINSFDSVFVYNSSSSSENKMNKWNLLGTTALSQIDIGDRDHIVGVNKDENVFRWNSSKQSWEKLPGSLVQVSIGADGSIFGVNKNDLVFKWNPVKSQWTKLPGQLTFVSVGRDDKNVIGLNKHGWAYQWIDNQWKRFDDYLYRYIRHLYWRMDMFISMSHMMCTIHTAIHSRLKHWIILMNTCEILQLEEIPSLCQEFLQEGKF